MQGYGAWVRGWPSCSSPTFIPQPHTLTWGCIPRRKGHLFQCAQNALLCARLCADWVCQPEREPFLSHSQSGICVCTSWLLSTSSCPSHCPFSTLRSSALGPRTLTLSSVSHWLFRSLGLASGQPYLRDHEAGGERCWVFPPTLSWHKPSFGTMPQ